MQHLIMVCENSAIKWELIYGGWGSLCGIASSVFMKLCLSSTSIERSNQANWGKKSIIKMPVQGLFPCDNERQRLFLCEN